MKKILVYTKSEFLEKLLSKCKDRYELKFINEAKQLNLILNADYSLLILDEFEGQLPDLSCATIFLTKNPEDKPAEYGQILVKPIRIVTLFAVIENLLTKDRTIRIGDCSLDLNQRLIQKSVDMLELKLTEIETKILEFFLKTECAKTKPEIVEKVWGHKNDLIETGVVSVALAKLRKKLKEAEMHEVEKVLVLS